MKEIEIHFKGGDGKRIKTLPEVPDNNDYVDLLTPQDIDGKKNFTQTPTINGKDITTQEKLDEVSNSKQNTLTAGNGISIENDTISVTDAGGLTVLTNSDFPLSADLLAKVNANPQKYCIKDTDTILYYDSQDLLFLYYNDLQVKKAAINNDVNLQQSRSQIERLNGKLHPLIKHIIVFANTTTKVAGNTLTVVGIEDTTDDSVKTGAQIRKAITIRKWH